MYKMAGAHHLGRLDKIPIFGKNIGKSPVSSRIFLFLMIRLQKSNAVNAVQSFDSPSTIGTIPLA